MDDILLKIQKQSEQNETILNSLKQIQETNTSIMATIAFLSEQNSDLKNKLECLEINSKKDKEYITLLENRLEDSQRVERKSNIEIKNVQLPTTTTKTDLLNMVSKLTETLDTKMADSDIKDIIRIRNKKSETSTIIVEFNNTFIKTDIPKAAKKFNAKNKNDKLCAKHLGMQTNQQAPIYLSENLTQKSSRLYFLARDLKTSKSYKYCWTNFGKVYVRLDDETPIIPIKSEAQVHQLMNTM